MIDVGSNSIRLVVFSGLERGHRIPGGAPRTLFATHYHELTETAVELDDVANLRMGVRERGDEVMFLHRVEDGPSDRSYGIQVARLAGVPAGVVRRATEILANLERDEYGRDGLPRRAHGQVADGAQPTLFGLFEPDRPAPPAEDPAVADLLAEIRGANPSEMTPLEALNLLAAWQRRLRGEEG